MHLYLHIPFCKQACHYCDFHFSVNTAKKKEMVDSIGYEIRLQKNYLKNTVLSSIYFGGGTPSLLSESEIHQIFSTISECFNLDNNAEITLECNPDDITIPRLLFWKSIGINRLSIGVQSFNNEHLKFLNRAHNSEHSSQCIKDAIDVGFENITIDLIYAIPSISNEIWKLDLQKAFDFGIPHISSYCLTIEEKTVFGKKVKQKLMKPIDDGFASDQFNLLLESMDRNGYEQYEISNFAKNERYAKHNTSYWLGEEYLGIGPSAHSFNGTSRQWNVSNNGKYINSISKGDLLFELEILSEVDKANEYIMTGLRTKWGVDLKKLAKYQDITNAEFVESIVDFKRQGLVLESKDKLFLSQSGKLKADYIASTLFF
jgi:oxygen-independent coproporphyrinogen-3 oxidase